MNCVAISATFAGMEPAASIIKKLGGVEDAARDLGVHRTRVFSWMRDAAAGGTGGRIPQRHFPTILDLSAKRGLGITAESLITAPPSQPVKAGAAA